MPFSPNSEAKSGAVSQLRTNQRSSTTFEPLLRLGNTFGVAMLPSAFFRKALPTKAGIVSVPSATGHVSGILGRLGRSAGKVCDGSVASADGKLQSSSSSLSLSIIGSSLVFLVALRTSLSSTRSSISLCELGRPVPRVADDLRLRPGSSAWLFLEVSSGRVRGIGYRRGKNVREFGKDANPLLLFQFLFLQQREEPRKGPKPV